MPATHLRVCSFKGLQNLPLYVAMRLGRFAAHALDVEVHYAVGSAQQVAGLARGEYELIQTAPDNVIAAHGNPAAFGLDHAARLVMVLGGSVGPLSVYGRPSVNSLAALRDGTLGVDNPASGFALVACDLLTKAGLVLGRDFSFTVCGGTSARLDAVLRGAVDATLLYAPYDTQAEAAGCVRLVTSAARYAAYASLATAGLRSWVESHGDTLVRYIVPLLEALRWIHAPANAAAVRAILCDEPALALDAATAEVAQRAFVAPETGFGATALLEPAGLEQVIALRARYGASAQANGGIPTVTELCDMQWYQRALEIVI
jgi:ABC-type nitrate/sulfonate/bicarbonate transport system substrate-binding protein